MIVEIDQSGKLEQLNTGTAIAFANGKNGEEKFVLGESGNIHQRTDYRGISTGRRIDRK